MKSGCNACYKMRQPHITTCPECGKETCSSQVIGLTCLLKCSNCEFEVAGASFFPACWSSDPASILICKPEDPKKMVCLARVLSMNSIELHKAFLKSGDQIEVASDMKECIRRFRSLSALGIQCTLGEDIKEFERAVDCPFADEFFPRK